MQILIIEDEIPAAKQLEKLLRTCAPDATIVGVLDAVETAVNWFNISAPPDLVFMDIQIADGLSFDIFSQVKVPAPVIFTTAFDQYAVQAFKVNAIDYLLKPVDPEDLQRALEKVQQSQQPVDHARLEKMLALFQKPNYKDRFLVKSGQHFVVLPCSEIAWFRSSDGLTQAYTISGKKHFIEHTLDELERLLEPQHFFRTSRNTILCTAAIKAIHPHLNGRLKLETIPVSSEDIFVSRERVAAFKEWLGG